MPLLRGVLIIQFFSKEYHYWDIAHALRGFDNPILHLMLSEGWETHRFWRPNLIRIIVLYLEYRLTHNRVSQHDMLRAQEYILSNQPLGNNWKWYAIAQQKLSGNQNFHTVCFKSIFKLVFLYSTESIESMPQIRNTLQKEWFNLQHIPEAVCLSG